MHNFFSQNQYAECNTPFSEEDIRLDNMMSSVVGSLEKVLIGHFQYLKMNKMNTPAGYLEKTKKKTKKTKNSQITGLQR